MFNFTCNICSAANTVESEASLDRDSPVCPSCGSNVRFRWTIHAISLAVFGKSIPLSDFPEARHITAIGLSDEPLYANTLANKLGYLNTFYHRDPQFDITDSACGESSSLDFIIATEVFEHIPPPIQPAFNNLARLLKPDGFVVFSTPWRPDGYTTEHFPDLYRWTLTKIGEEYVLVNKTRSGKYELFDELVFHGGAGQTLEMRLFSRPSLEQHFLAAGLQAEFPSEPCLKYGIIFNKPWSLPCILRKRVSVETSGPVQEKMNGQEVLPEYEALKQARMELAELYRKIDSQTDHVQRLSRRNLSLEREQEELKRRIEELLQKLSLIKDSKWLKLGRRFNFGPKL
jgi:SAM-dependent methyltransferase